MFDVSQGVTRILDSDAALTFSCRIKKSTLDVQMRLICNYTIKFWFLAVFASSLKLIDIDAVFVNSWTDNEVCCFVFNEEVAKSLGLIEASTGSHSKHSFPCILSGKTVVEFISKFNAVSVRIEFRVEVEVARGILC
jgi:hypothetical protein